MEKLVVTLEVAKGKAEAIERAKASLDDLQKHFIFKDYTLLVGGKHACEWGKFTEAPYVLTAPDKKKLTLNNFTKPVAFGKKPEAFDLLQTLFVWQLQERKKYILQIRQGIVIRDLDELVHEEDSDLREAFLGASCGGKYEHVFSGGTVICTRGNLSDVMKVPKGHKLYIVPALIECLNEKRQ